ncbi:mandelate racemase/muconate lactonizing enzyme family protein [Tunicatimonas pelagia]|uniref:mandelate racemase/muconate lactonizing enzyme family protein n=1 Tax=Tunicatimonas pelagia TaxID=931531 RepID=UPI002666604B|nr:mandelate racemase/muconate lactonizing enzyme family protein [Tunicatimonas pelagia]WKN44991.1 mandelate racemase/muconate lactonizing enzyme family protein [Tunicatimonas pelagia]
MSPRINRRSFLQQATLTSAGAIFLPVLPGLSRPSIADPIIPDLKKKLGGPVMIESVELLKYKKEFVTIVTSTDGVQGICVGNGKLASMLTFFGRQIKPFFERKDATQIEPLLEAVMNFRRNYKYAGMTLWNSVAQVELATLDMLGKTAQLPVSQLLGEVVRTEVPIYMSSTLRSTTAEEEVEWVGKRIAETGAKAAKLKIGGRMSKNVDAYPGRSEDLIRLSRETWGDAFTIYMDANGSYDVPNAIEMGKFMQDYNIGFYEEPVFWEDFAGTKAVNEGLAMPVVGGEQDSSLPKWEWMIKSGAIDTAQPDIMYNGGMIRTLQVAKMAADTGIDCTLHSPKRNAIASCMLHFAAITPNIDPFQEYRAKLDGYSDLSPDFPVKNGMVQVPTEPGFGVDYDLDFLKKFKTV